MDTVRMYWQDYKESREVKSYLDRLGDAEGISKNEREFLSPDSIYRDIGKYTIKGKPIFLMRSPKYKKLPKCAISFHCSKFNNFNHVNQWLHQALGGDLSLIEDATVSRLDLCVDVAIDFDYAFQTVRRKRGRKTTIYHSKKGSSIYFGERPLQHVLYEKWVPPEKVDQLNGIRVTAKGFNKIKVLRIEARHFSTKCPAKKWSEVPKVADINPFLQLEKLKVDQTFISNLPTQKRRSIEAFLYECEKVGFDFAVKQRNKPAGRFAKTIGQYMVDANTDLSGAWKYRCQNWFETAGKSKNNQLVTRQKSEVHSDL